MVRMDFVSNSSSSSFIIDTPYFAEQKCRSITRDELVNAIRRNFFPEDWIHKNCYMTVLDMDDVRKNIKGKVSFKKLLDYNKAFWGIQEFEDHHDKLLTHCVVNPESKFYIYMGDNDCYGMIDAQTDNTSKFKTSEASIFRVFELLFHELGIPLNVKSLYLHGNGHLG